jgi:hypothetical protein
MGMLCRHCASPHGLEQQLAEGSGKLKESQQELGTGLWVWINFPFASSFVWSLQKHAGRELVNKTYSHFSMDKVMEQ